MMRRASTGLTAIAIGILALGVAPARAQDDHGNSCGTATAIATDGTSVDAIIDPASDEDWLSFSAIAGERYDATTFIASAAFYYEVQVIGPDCATVWADWSYASPDERTVVPATTGTHYIRIRSISGGSVGYINLGITD